ncbi:MAG: ImmA/IrrE family metallo-endopeptidase [Acetatifactor sp.]
MDNINVVYVDMPAGVRSYVVLNSDESYTIVINSRLSHEQNLLSYYHEIDHIKNGDYDRNRSADLIEIVAHNCTYEGICK